MNGKLEISLDPSFLAFESPGHVRRFHYCAVDELARLLLDLKVIESLEMMPKNELYASIYGDFPKEVLARYGLVAKVKMKGREIARSADSDPAAAF